MICRKSLWKPFSVVLALSIALTGGACKKKEAAPAEPQQIVLGPADVALVTSGPVESGPALSGTLTAEEQATVRAQIAGSVIETFAEPGDAVRRGEVLARIDTAALTEALTSARAAVTNARNNVAQAQREEERQKILAEAGAVAERNVETARQTTVGARASLAQAQAQLSAAQKQLGNTRVSAPFAGVVSEKQTSAGDVVQPGTALYTVVDPSSLELEAAVSAQQLAQLRVGTPVTFRVNGFPNRTFRGQITRINPAADPATRQVRVYAEIPNPGSDLVAGLFAEGRVESQSRNGLILPVNAIDRRMIRPAVLRVKDGKIERVEVQLGLLDEQAQRIEVRQGVRAGDVVLLGAAQEIPPGTPVRLAPAVAQQVERLAQKL
ncbi:MAG TPA: efflux RND transporter periplasmic adaptor subunit [Thermoanaerobaculia bacterium]|nr:efflux RND transporter periplasmic adaptor subunit [Thermoanaerobaculia bacterium]